MKTVFAVSTGALHCAPSYRQESAPLPSAAFRPCVVARRRPSVRRLPLFLWLLTFLLAACGKKDEPATAPTNLSSDKVQRNAMVMPTATNAIQAEINRLSQLPLQHSPTNRPLVLSERQSNRRDWCVHALESGYRDSGHTNPRWDADVRQAFAGYADYVRVTPNWSNYFALTNGLRRAVTAQCDDPMIGYLNARYLVADFSTSGEQTALALLRAHRAMLSSRYHPYFKFIAGYRAINAARDADEKGNRSRLIEFVTIALEDLARDTNAPAAEVFEPVNWWIDHTHESHWADYVLYDLGPILDRNWSGEESYDQLEATIELSRAWASRGSDWANTVTDAGWEGFRRHLEAAESFLTRAWAHNPTNNYTAYLMMRLELGQGRGRARMERWFQRAMAISPNYYDAAQLMSYYLEPRWYGSEDQCLEFARQCVSNTNWGGNVPLVLTHTHDSLAQFHKLAESSEYWQRPEVWQDIQASYERFFQLNPDAAGYHHDYAKHAYLCGHYDVFLAQTRLFPSTNFTYFGGPERFRQMLARAAGGGSQK